MAGRKTIYEWTVEIMDGEDIIDACFYETLAEAKSFAASIDGPIDIGLVRDVWDEDEGLLSRSWAYLKNGALPPTLNEAGDDFGYAIPRRFLAEARRNA